MQEDIQDGISVTQASPCLLDHIYTPHSQATDKDPVVTLSRMMFTVIKFI